MKILARLIHISPFLLVAGILDYRFHHYFWRPINILRPIRPPPMFDFWSVWDFGVVVLACILIVSLIFSKQKLELLKKMRWLKYVIGAIIGGIIVSAFSYAPAEPVIHSLWGQVWSSYIAPVIFLLTLFALGTTQDREKFTDNLLIAFALLGALSIFEFTTDLLPGARTDFLGRLVWPYIDPFVGMKAESANWLAFIFGPLLILAVIKMLKKPGWFYGCIIAIHAAVLLLTKSYSGIGVSILLISWLLINYIHPRHKKILLIGLMALSIIVIASQYHTKKFQILLGNYSKENSLERRAQIYKFTWQAIKENPIGGIGPGNYQSYFRKNMARHGTIIPEEELPPHPHNLIAQFTTDLGILGFLAIIILYIITAFSILTKPLVYAGAFPFAFFLGHGLADAAYGLPEISALFWILMWYYVTYPQDNRNKERENI